MKPLRLTPLAQQEVDSIAAHIAAEHPDAAWRFLGAVQRDCDLIRSQPEMGGLRWSGLLPALGTVRFLPVSQFRNWLLFYVETDAEILVLRVLHGARDIPTLFRP